MPATGHGDARTDRGCGVRPGQLPGGARIDERIAELVRLKNGLAGCIGRGRLSLDRRAVLNPDDRVASHGPGTRYWLGDPRPAE